MKRNILVGTIVVAFGIKALAAVTVGGFWGDESKLYSATPEVEHGYRTIDLSIRRFADSSIDAGVESSSGIPTAEFELPLVEQKVIADERVEACRGLVAYQTGPIVWSWETHDTVTPAVKVANYARLNTPGYARVWIPDPSALNTQHLKLNTPLLGGFHPDPSVTKGADGAYYLVTSSFMWQPGIPVYRSENFRDWESIGCAVRDFNGLNNNRPDWEDGGVWAPTIRYAKDRYWIVFTFHGKRPENYIISAENPAGPWTKPRKIAMPDNGGIDPSLFFDDDGKVYLQVNRMIPDERKEWRGQCECVLVEFDLENAAPIGEPKVITTGVFKGAKNAEGPHLMKIGGKYLYYLAEGGTGATHAATMLESGNVWGPYVPVRGNPLITRRDRGPGEALTCAGHMDIVQRNGNDYYAVFLGVRTYGADGRTLLSRETFACPFKWRDGAFIAMEDELIAGRLVNEDEWARVGDFRLRRVPDIAFDLEVEVAPGESAALYRNAAGNIVWPKNETGAPQKIRLVSTDGLTVQAYLGGEPFGEKRDLKPLSDAARKTRFNGLGYGVLRAGE